LVHGPEVLVRIARHRFTPAEVDAFFHTTREDELYGSFVSPGPKASAIGMPTFWIIAMRRAPEYGRRIDNALSRRYPSAATVGSARGGTVDEGMKQPASI
jgi:hypothetical protein